MDLWNIIVWVVVGGLAGWAASKLMGTDKEQGIFGNVVLGVVGAIVGGVLFGLLGGAGFTGFNIWSFLVALVGAVIILWLRRLFVGRK